MGFAAAEKPTSHTGRLLETEAGAVYVLRDTVDMDDFKSHIWLAVLVHKTKQRTFEEKLGKEPLNIAEFGKVVLRSGSPITPEMAAAAVEGVHA